MRLLALYNALPKNGGEEVSYQGYTRVLYKGDGSWNEFEQCQDGKDVVNAAAVFTEKGKILEVFPVFPTIHISKGITPMVRKLTENDPDERIRPRCDKCGQMIMV